MTESLLQFTPRYGGTALAISLWLAAALPAAGALSPNLQIIGNLVAEPCTLDASSDLTVAFGSVIKKDLYQYSRSRNQPFTIVLQGCDLSMGKQAVVTFSGTGVAGLPGYLAVSGAAGGIGIGIGMAEVGLPPLLLPIGRPSTPFALAAGTNRLTFLAWVEAVPEAIAKKTIGAGDFSATATFVMSYP